MQPYDVIEVQGNKKHIHPMENNFFIIFYIHDEELYDILLNTYISIRHGGRNSMMNELEKKKNITLYNFKTFFRLCKSCV